MNRLLTTEERALSVEDRSKVFADARKQKDAEEIARGGLHGTKLKDGLPEDWNKVIMVHQNDANVMRKVSFVTKDMVVNSNKITIKYMNPNVSSSNTRGVFGRSSLQLQVRTSSDGNT